MLFIFQQCMHYFQNSNKAKKTPAKTKYHKTTVTTQSHVSSFLSYLLFFISVREHVGSVAPFSSLIFILSSHDILSSMKVWISLLQIWFTILRVSVLNPTSKIKIWQLFVCFMALWNMRVAGILVPAPSSSL